MQFAIDVVPDRGRVIVAPSGELDIGTAEQVWERVEQLRENGFDRIVLDLRSVSFIDSSGLRLIVRARDWAQRDGFEFALIDGAEAVSRMFDLTGLREHLEFARA